MMTWLEKPIQNNLVLTWLYAAGAVLGVVATLKFLQWLVVGRLQGTDQRGRSMLDDAALHIARHTSTFFQAAMGLAAASYILDLPNHLDRRVRVGVVVISIIQSGIWSSGVIGYLIDATVARHADGDVAKTGTNMLRFFGSVAVWCAVVLLVLDNLGINITTLIAGLGVTGVAVALATQNIVSDLFASVSILLDKPFLVGDFIVCDAFMGSVERIGIKTTRLRSLGGELLIMANSDLSKSRIRNYRNMHQRRVLFTITVRLETSIDQLRKIPTWAQEAITMPGRTRFDRCQLLYLCDNGFQYETVYYVLDGDYNVYTAIAHEIHLGLLERLAAGQVQLATPARLLYHEALPKAS